MAVGMIACVGEKETEKELTKVTLIDLVVNCATKSYSYNALISGTKIESGTGYYSNTCVCN